MVLIGVGDVSDIVVLDDIGLVEGEIDSHSASNLHKFTNSRRSESYYKMPMNQNQPFHHHRILEQHSDVG